MTVCTKVKICGVTRPADAVLAAMLGADALGLNFYPKSPRSLTIDQARTIVAALPVMVETFAVFVDTPVDEIRHVLSETGIASVQLHGDEPPEFIAELAPLRVLRAFRWREAETARQIDQYLTECRKLGRLPTGVLIDAYVAGSAGGTGQTWQWTQAADLALTYPLVLAGGLTPENVTQAIRTAKPYGVDTSSGIECEPGIKDPEKLRRFIEAVRSVKPLEE